MTAAVVTAMTDQALATVADVERRCGANSHLIEDDDLNEVVRQALAGGPSVAVVSQDIQFGGSAMERGPRIFQRLARGDCDRCLSTWNGLNGRTLDIPAGASVVQVQCCPRCVAELSRKFAPIAWS